MAGPTYNGLGAQSVTLILIISLYLRQAFSRHLMIVLLVEK